MINRRLLGATAAVLAVALGACRQPDAAPQIPQEVSGQILSLRAASEQVLSRYQGQVMDVELSAGKRDEFTAAVYEVRFLTAAGNVLKIRLDAATGEFLEVDGRGLVEARRR